MMISYKSKLIFLKIRLETLVLKSLVIEINYNNKKMNTKENFKN